MAQIATLAAPWYTVPKTKTSLQARSITLDIGVTGFAANVTQGDNILVVTLPKYTRINDSGIRVVGTCGLTGAFVTLRSTENGVSTNLTNPISATTSGATCQCVAPPQVSRSYAKTLEVLVGGNSVDSTATGGVIEVTLNYDNFQLSG